MDEGEGDSVGERGGGPRTPHQPPQQPNAQTRKQPLVNVQAITNPEAKKGKPQTRDSLSESALSVKTRSTSLNASLFETLGSMGSLAAEPRKCSTILRIQKTNARKREKAHVLAPNPRREQQLGHQQRPRPQQQNWRWKKRRALEGEGWERSELPAYDTTQNPKIYGNNRRFA